MFVGEMLLGVRLSGVEAVVARVTGIALLGLGIACWPGPPRVGMLTYSAGVALYLAWVGLTAESTGVFLWPAVAIHAALSATLALDRSTEGDTRSVPK
ncbi:hypothetical protein [Rhodoplanes sp.]|uniref:hypothetical protein n=1 Tax=Rhodoplanes sp. TaxID=1968906 RepID=UPI0025FCEA46|nr:hypothetical protein [Rhodoplanes sp.]